MLNFIGHAVKLKLWLWQEANINRMYDATTLRKVRGYLCILAGTEYALENAQRDAGACSFARPAFSRVLNLATSI